MKSGIPFWVILLVLISSPSHPNLEQPTERILYFQIINNLDSLDPIYELEFLDSIHSPSPNHVFTIQGKEFQFQNPNFGSVFRLRQVGPYQSKGFWSPFYYVRDFLKNPNPPKVPENLSKNNPPQEQTPKPQESKKEEIFQILMNQGKPTRYLNSKELVIVPTSSQIPATVYYRINSSPWQNLSQKPITFPEDGFFILEYYSEDILGNQESIQSVEFFVDRTPPNTNIRFPYYQDPNGVLFTPGSGRITLEAVDNLSGVKATYYRILCNPTQEPNYTIYQESLSISSLQGMCEREILLEYYSEDNAGNQEKPKLFLIQK